MTLPNDEGEFHRLCGEIVYNKGLPNKALGAFPNPLAVHCNEFERRKKNKETIALITEKIEAIYEPRFITPPETSELIESLVTASNSQNILEVGLYSGFGTLHVLRAIVGKYGARITSIDCNPAHDRDFFARKEFEGYFNFIEGRTPECLSQFIGQRPFDMVFVDSDHSLEHNEAERKALIEITTPRSIWLFHDLPEWNVPTNQVLTDVRKWVNGLVASGFMEGLAFPTCEQADCLRTFGPGYPMECSPHLGIFRRLK